MELSFFIYVFILTRLCKNIHHLLRCLLRLEGIIVGVILSMGVGVSLGLISFVGLIVFIYVVVCEGVLGLGVLVIIIHGGGKDKFLYNNVY